MRNLFEHVFMVILLTISMLLSLKMHIPLLLQNNICVCSDKSGSFRERRMPQVHRRRPAAAAAVRPGAVLPERYRSDRRTRQKKPLCSPFRITQRFVKNDSLNFLFLRNNFGRFPVPESAGRWLNHCSLRYSWKSGVE